jgi:peptidoglycan/LPS O-acetylase OafA/YrhL
MSSKQKLETIHGLRGVAALMVVLMHFSNFLQPVAPQFSSFLSNGYLGVDVFFVISGFIIYISTQEASSRNSIGFLIRRFCRVALPAWAALMLAVLIQPPYLKDLILSVLFIPLQNDAPPYYGYSVLIVAWTLTYELFFYLLFSAALSFSFGRKHRGLVAAFLIVVFVGLAQSQDCCSLDPYRAPLFVVGGGHFPSQLVSLAGNPILLEFAVGIFLAWAYVNRLFHRIEPGALLLTAPFTLFLIARFQYVHGHGLSRGGLLAAAMVFYVLCLQAWRDKRALADVRQRDRIGVIGRTVLYLGEISYSMYLVHPSIKSLMTKVLARATTLQTAGIDACAFVFAILCTLACSALFYRWVELPAHRLGRTLAARLPNKVLRVGAPSKASNP